nr:helix-turn-helix domain-containing protein [uncultured Carboxylicivirga sp.]
MTLKSERDFNYGREKLYREQIVTTTDLVEFKKDLLQELSNILVENFKPGAKKWLKSCEVRKLLGISPGTLQSMRINGELPFTKVGGMLFYDYQDIQKMLSKNKVDSPSRFSR